MIEVEARTFKEKVFHLNDRTSRAETQIAPSRGGMATRFDIGSFPLFALDPETLADPSRNVRGGMPILFPSPGPLPGGRYESPLVTAPMKQHGFARDLAWSVVTEDAGESGEARRLTLGLSSTSETRAQFPFDFELLFTYELAGTTLRLLQSYENRSRLPMPLHAGFHPYFHVPDSEKGRTFVETGASRAYDNVSHCIVEVSEIDLTRPEVDLHLLDHGAPRSAITRPGVPRVVLSASPEFKHWVVWTVAGKDFVCVEPWTAPAGALNSGGGLLWLEPGETRRLWLEISAG